MTWRPTSERKRNTYIGSRDAAAITGHDRFASAGDVFAKMKRDHEVKQNRKMKRGLLIEPGVIEYAERVRGVSISRDVFYLEERNPFGTSLDGAEGDVRRPDTIHEVKSTRSRDAGPEFSDRWGREGSEEVDPACYAQVQWSFGVTGARLCHVWLYDLDEDFDPRHFVVRRNQRFIDEMRAACDDFYWTCIIGDVVPRVAPKSAEAAGAIWPAPEADTIITNPTPTFLQTAWEYDCARVIRDKAEEKLGELVPTLLAGLDGKHKAKWEADPEKGILAGSVTHTRRLLDPTTDWETTAYQLAEIGKIPGETFKGVVDQNTRRFLSKPSTRVYISKPKAQP